MGFKNTYFFWVLIHFSLIGCQMVSQNPKSNQISRSEITSTSILVGASDFEHYLALLKNKSVGLVCNQGSVMQTKSGGYTHLLDTLLQQNITITTLFSPEHGFRGIADAGEKIAHESFNNIPIVSLYGTNYKPQPNDLQGVDILVFDLQDVGVRFYTYISTLHYVMEAAAEQKIPLLVLDRPNPNAHYIDGPVLEKKYTSFVGMHPVPVVYGMTIGEYAQMINGEKWLKNGIQAQLTVIKNRHYTHHTRYDIPVKPSPNLPNSQAIQLYPSLCFFEGTNVSCGRGTNKQFQVYGSPFLPAKKFSYSFTPQPNEGAKEPLHQGKICFGENLENHPELHQLNLNWLQKAYQQTDNPTLFFNAFFNKLAGNEQLKQQIIQKKSGQSIRNSWQKDLESFKKTRSQYLLYP